MLVIRVFVCLMTLIVSCESLDCKNLPISIKKACECDDSSSSVRCKAAPRYNNDTSLLTLLPPDVKRFEATGFHFEDVPQIGQCHRQMQLVYLDLSHNRIWNVTSDSFRCLSNLETLVLADNSWHLPLPNTIFTATLNKLRVLNLERAFFKLINCSDEVKENCTNSLTKLSWYVNGISNLVSLEELNLAGNYIWTIPADAQEEIAHLQHLRHLNLSANELTFPSLILKPSNQIETLDISGNRIPYLQDDFLGDLSKFRNLSKLFLNNNEFVCDCHMETFISWLQNGTISPYVQKKESLTCWEGVGKVKAGMKLMNVSVADLTCKEYPIASTSDSNIVIGILIGASITAVLVILFLNRSSIKKCCCSTSACDSRYASVNI